MARKSPKRRSQTGGSQAGGRSGIGRKVDPQRLRRTLGRMANHGRTLLVDDNRYDLEIIRLKLGMVAGPTVEIETARGIATAVDKFNRHEGRFDLLIFNHRLMPDQTGADLLAALQQSPKFKPLKSVLYSSRMTSTLVHEAAVAGFDAAVPTDDLDSMSSMSELIWRLIKPDIDWSASWRGLP